MCTSTYVLSGSQIMICCFVTQAIAQPAGEPDSKEENYSGFKTFKHRLQHSLLSERLKWALSSIESSAHHRSSSRLEFPHTHTHTKITMINTTTCHQSFSSHSKTGQNFRHNQHMLRTNTSLTYIKWFNFDNILTEGQIIVQHLP